MNFVVRLALVCIIITTCTGGAAAANKRSVSKLEGLEYPQARKIILGYGWTPHTGGCLENEEPEICDQFPELINCTQGQPEFCILRFAKSQRCLQITTRGGYLEDNGGTMVDQAVFTNQKCRNSF